MDVMGLVLPVVYYLVSQRTGSIQISGTYFVVVRLVWFNRISLQHGRPVDHAQEPNEELGCWDSELLTKPALNSHALAEQENIVCEPPSCCLVLGDLGVRLFAARGSGLWTRPRPGKPGGALVMRYAQGNLARVCALCTACACASSPGIPGGGHEAPCLAAHAGQQAIRRVPCSTEPRTPEPRAEQLT